MFSWQQDGGLRKTGVQRQKDRGRAPSHVKLTTEQCSVLGRRFDTLLRGGTGSTQRLGSSALHCAFMYKWAGQ
jgi:hypothetical protein